MAEEVGSLSISLSVDTADFSRSMTDINRKLRGLNSEFKANTAGSKNYENSLEGLQTRSKYLNDTLTLQRARVQRLKQEYDKSVETKGRDAKETENLAIRYNRAATQMKRTESQLESVDQRIKEQTNSWRRLGREMEIGGQQLQAVGRSVQGIGRSLSMFVTAPLVGAGTAAVKLGMDFEEGMSQVEALSGATAEQMQALEEQARELGATTRFSALEASEGMQFLSMAGFDVNETMEAMPGMLNLATAGALELGRAADITSNIMSGFSLEADEAGRVSDVLAEAASNANTDVNQLGEAMGYLAPAANSMGWEVEEATAAVMSLSNAGIQGSRAGSTFSTSLTRLANPTGKAAELIEELGIELFNAEGQMKSMPDVVAEFEDSMEGMDDKTRAATLATIVGQEAYRSWSVLLEEGSVALAENTEQLQGAEGAAARMAETMNDNAKGSLLELKSTLEELGLILSETLLPIAQDWTETITEWARGFQELDPDMQQFIITTGGIAAAAGPALMVIGSMANGLGAILSVAGRLLPALGMKAGLAGAVTALTGPVGIAVGAVGALGAAAWGVNSALQRNKEVNLEAAETMHEQIGTLDQQIERWESLDNANKLTNDEMLRFMEIQEELKSVTDPEAIAALTQEQDDLRAKSGLSNDQLNEFVSVNRSIADQVPGVTGEISKYGDVYIENMNKVKQYNEAQREALRLELEAQATKAENEKGQLLEQNKDLQEEINNRVSQEGELAQNVTQSRQEYEQAMQRLKELQEDTTSLNAREREEAQMLVDEKREEYNTAQLIYDTNRESLAIAQEKRAEVANEIGELDEVYNRLIDIELANAGVNAEHGKGIEEINEQISNLEMMKENIIENASESEKQTQKYKDGIAAIDEQIEELNGVRNKIVDLQRKSDLLNESLGADINKTVTIRQNVQSSYISPRDTLGNILQNTPGYAAGTDYHPGGWAVVGEEGPELLNLPRGSQVFTASETERMLRDTPRQFHAIGQMATTNLSSGLESGVKSVSVSMEKVMDSAFDTANQYDGTHVGKSVVRTVLEGIREAENMADVNITSLLSSGRDSAWSSRSRSAIQKTRDIRDSNIRLLEQEIQLLTQEGATQEDLNKAKEKQAELDVLRDQKMQEYQNRIRDEQAILKELKKAYEDGEIIQSQYNQAVAEVTTNINNLKIEANQLNQIIGEEQAEAVQKAKEAEEQALRDRQSYLDRIRDVRSSNIQLLEQEIDYLTREGATQNELARAKEKQIELDDLRNEKLREYERRIEEQRRLITNLNQAVQEGTIAQAEYNREVANAEIEINNLEGQIISLNRTIENEHIEAIRKAEAEAERLAQTAANAFSRVASDQISAYNTVMNEQLQALRNKNKLSIEAFKEETNAYITELNNREQAEIDVIDRQLARMDEEDKRRGRDEQRADWETERERLNRRLTIAEFMGDGATVEAVKQEIADFEEEVANQRREWEREDKRESLRNEKERIQAEYDQKVEAYNAERELQLEKIQREHEAEEKAFQQEFQRQQERFALLQQKLNEHVQSGQMTQEQANAAWIQAVEDLGIKELEIQIENQERTQEALEEYVDKYVEIGESYGNGLIGGLTGALKKGLDKVRSTMNDVLGTISSSRSGGSDRPSNIPGSESNTLTRLEDGSWGTWEERASEREVTQADRVAAAKRLGKRLERERLERERAERYHDGGWVGRVLNSDEVPAILQAGEFVLSLDMLEGIRKVGKALGNLTRMRVPTNLSPVPIPQMATDTVGSSKGEELLRKNLQVLETLVSAVESEKNINLSVDGEPVATYVWNYGIDRLEQASRKGGSV